jgi:U4/U6 small nuclear ribonucleoprotein PRP4
MKQHIATTSFDHSWRLWDINRYGSDTQNYSELLLQDGHCCEVYGIGFHPDGSLCATTDYAGIVQLWDLRTGKSIRHYIGHTKRILNAEFHPCNGYQLATAGDDGTIRIWDLRKQTKGCVVSIPAHSNLISSMKYDPVYGEYIISSSFDGMIKLWNTRNYKLIHQFRAGHEGKVSSVDLLYHHDNTTINNKPDISFVSCGFDKTLKMWR